MARPDLTEHRTAEILDAFERCVAQFGLAGSSLEMVAEEANVKRSIIRHYVGNRDELIEALAQRVMGKYRELLDAVIAELPKENRVDQMLNFLFGEASAEDVQSMLVVEALIAVSGEYPICQDLVSEYIKYLVDTLSKELHEEYPLTKQQQCWAVAYGVIGICFNNESLVPLALPKKYHKASRDCAQWLISTLG